MMPESSRRHLRRRVRRRALTLLPALVAIPLLATGAAANDVEARRAARAAERTTWDSVFTAAQAERGQSAYKEACARCHRESMAGADEAPALTGSAFMSAWNGQTLGDLHERIRTSMPTDTPGVYGRQQVTDVIAYMLQFNGYPAGAAELSKESEALKEVRFVAGKP